MLYYILSFLAGAFAVVLSNWIQSTKKFSERPLVLSGDQRLGYKLIHQRPFSFALAAGTKALYGNRAFGTDTFLTRLVQKTLRVTFQNYCIPCTTDKILSFADSNKIAHSGWDKPISEYKSVDEFFTRKYEKLVVKKDPNSILAPSEGTVVGYPSLDIAASIWIKQKYCTLQNMGIPNKYIKEMGDRQNVQIYKLDVYDLHRYYAPVSGLIVSRIDYLEPLRFSHSVRPVALKAGWDIMTENRRVILVIQIEDSNEHVVMMVVGGIGVDSIDIKIKEGEKVEQGDEIGMFHMGGSAILIASSATAWKQRDDIEVASVLGVEVQSRIGDVMMRKV